MKCSRPFILLLGVLVFASLSYAQHLTSAKLYLKYKQYEQAEASALKAVEKDPGDEEAWFVLGEIRHEVKKYPEMVDAFNKAAAIDPEEHKDEIQRFRYQVWAISHNAGVKYYNRGRDTASYFQMAIDSLRTAMLARPESLRTYYVCALAYYGSKHVPEAIKILNASLEKDPKQIEELTLLGKLHSQLARERQEAKDSAGSKQEYHIVLSVFEKLYDLDHSNTDNMLNLIDMYESLGQGDNARTLTRDALTADPNNRDLLYVSGIFLLRQDSCAASIEKFSKIGPLKPDSVDALYADTTQKIGVAYLQWGIRLKKEADAKAEAAQKAKKKGFKEDTSYLEKLKAAIPYFVKTTELKPKEVDIWQQLGKIYAFVGMGKEAEAAYKKFDELSK